MRPLVRGGDLKSVVQIVHHGYVAQNVVHYALAAFLNGYYVRCKAQESFAAFQILYGQGRLHLKIRKRQESKPSGLVLLKKFHAALCGSIVLADYVLKLGTEHRFYCGLVSLRHAEQFSESSYYSGRSLGHKELYGSAVALVSFLQLVQEV